MDKELTIEQKAEFVEIEVQKPITEKVSIQEIDDRVADLVQHIANTQAEIDTLLAKKDLAKIELKK